MTLGMKGSLGGGPSKSAHVYEYSDPSLDIPPLPPKPKTQKKKPSSFSGSSSVSAPPLPSRDFDADSPVPGGGNSISSNESAPVLEMTKRGRMRKAPKGGDDFVFER